MRPITVTVGPLAAASSNNIALSQVPSSVFTLNGALASNGVATTDNPRRVLFTASGNESAKTLTISGTDWSGALQTELLAGPNASTVYTVTDFRTVTRISLSAPASGTISVGTNSIASSAWIRLDEFSSFPTAMQCSVTGTVNYSVQQTLQDPNSPYSPMAAYLVQWVATADPNVVGATTTQQSSYTYAPLYSRVLLNSGAGSVSFVVSQSGSSSF